MGQERKVTIVNFYTFGAIDSASLPLKKEEPKEK